MLELPKVSVLTKFGSGVSPKPASVSTGQLLATLPGSSSNWLPKPAGLPTGPRVPFPTPHCVYPTAIPASCVPPVKDPTPHCAFPYIPNLTLWHLLMSLLPFPFPALCNYPNSPFPLAASPFLHCAYPLP